MEMAIIPIEAQKRILSHLDSSFFVILNTTDVPTIRNNKSISGLCEIPSGTIISKGKRMQCTKHRTAAEIPI